MSKRKKDLRYISKHKLLGMYKEYCRINAPEIYNSIAVNKESSKVYRIDTNIFKGLASYYMKNADSNNIDVIAHYGVFIIELRTQLEFILKTFDISLKQSSIDPYPKGYIQMRNYIQTNNRLVVWNGGKAVDPLEHTIIHGVKANVVFRWIHDLLGHYIPNNSFDMLGEENAYQVHKSFFSKDARGVLAQETRAQQAAYYYSAPYNTFKPQYLNIVPDEFI